MKKPRVLHAPMVALYQPRMFVRGLRQAGLAADYMTFNIPEHEQWLAHGCDIDLGLPLTTAEDYPHELPFFAHALDAYDVFHFHSGFGLLRQNPPFTTTTISDLGFLKSCGKKIVMHWWGCDRRTWDIDSPYKYSACHNCVEENQAACQRPAKLEMIELVERYADAQLSNGDLCASLPQIQWCDNAIDCDKWKPMDEQEIPEEYRLPPTDNLRIYHSFGNSSTRGDVKGSYEIEQAVKQLQAEGFKVEFLFFDKVPNTKLRYYQAQADIVVDQLRSGWHGSTAIECLACGRPVITYIRPEVQPLIPTQHPLINATIDNIYDVLKDLIQDKDKRLAIGQASRKYALETHDYRVLGKKLRALYEKL